MVSILNQNKINEATLLIEIEGFIQSSLNSARQPRSFYQNFADLLLDFHQVYDPDFSYSCLIEPFCRLLYDYDLEYESPESLCRLLKQTPFRQWQSDFDLNWTDHLDEMRQHRFSEKQNAQKIDSRLNLLIDEYSALLVVRVDLSYVANISIQQVDDDLEILRRKINRSQYGDDVLLLIWALEQGESTGYHCHVALVFDERKRHGAWRIAKAVGDWWKEITDDQGKYFNCHDRRYLKKYEERDVVGIGVIYSNVPYQVNKMRSTLSYLARPDKAQYLRVKTSAKMRSFGMSQVKAKINRRNCYKR